MGEFDEPDDPNAAYGMTGHSASYDANLAEPGGEHPRDQINALLTSSLFQQELVHAQWRRAMMVNAHERLAIISLWSAGTLTMSELGMRIPLSRAAITSLVDRLERLGYVTRTTDPDDRRRTELALTQRVAAVSRPVVRPYMNRIAAAADAYSDEEYAVIARFLKDVERISAEEAARLRGISDDDLMDIVDAAQRRNS